MLGKYGQSDFFCEMPLALKFIFGNLNFLRL